ncbi:MAG: hypothetical protein AAFX93_11080 [Verrucomicrobiota bacterium]
MKLNKMDRGEAYSMGRTETAYADEYANNDLPSGEIQVLPYRAKSYLCDGGGRLIHRDMVRRGMPTDFTGWLFVTLTLDREFFDHDPELGYLVGKERMRRFFDYLKKHGHKIEKWIWKLEFHPESPEWVHWHLLLDHRKFVPWELIQRAWNLGRVNVERVESYAQGQRIGEYEFKYVFKEGMGPPKWLLKYKRIRFIQTKGIFEKKSKTKDETVEEELNRKEEQHAYEGKDNRSESPTIGERMQMWKRKITAVYDTAEGKQVRSYELVTTAERFFGHLWNLPTNLRCLMAPFHAIVRKHQIILDYVRVNNHLATHLQGALG